MTWCVLIFPSRKRWMSLSIDYLLEGSDEHLTVRQWLPQGYQSECINTPTIVIAYTVYSISIIVYQFLDNSNESVFSEDMPCQLSPKVVKTIGTKFFPSDLVCFHQRPHMNASSDSNLAMTLHETVAGVHPAGHKTEPPKKKHILSMKYWLFNRDPCNVFIMISA